MGVLGLSSGSIESQEGAGLDKARIGQVKDLIYDVTGEEAHGRERYDEEKDVVVRIKQHPPPLSPSSQHLPPPNEYHHDAGDLRSLQGGVSMDAPR